VSWTNNIECSQCGDVYWHVKAGVWTCQSSHTMTPAAIAKYHATLPKPR
jgi:hypothetical protein